MLKSCRIENVAKEIFLLIKFKQGTSHKQCRHTWRCILAGNLILLSVLSHILFASGYNVTFIIKHWSSPSSWHCLLQNSALRNVNILQSTASIEFCCYKQIHEIEPKHSLSQYDSVINKGKNNIKVYIAHLSTNKVLKALNTFLQKDRLVKLWILIPKYI